MNSKHGFATMSPEERREIARRGGIAAQAQGKGFKFNSEKARAAGQLGGKTVSQDKVHMSRLGHLGGLTTSQKEGHMSRIGRLGGKALQAKLRILRAQTNVKSD